MNHKSCNFLPLEFLNILLKEERDLDGNSVNFCGGVLDYFRKKSFSMKNILIHFKSARLTMNKNTMKYSLYLS